MQKFPWYYRGNEIDDSHETREISKTGNDASSKKGNRSTFEKSNKSNTDY